LRGLYQVGWGVAGDFGCIGVQVATRLLKVG
jgi:hypothetical protein